MSALRGCMMPSLRPNSVWPRSSWLVGSCEREDGSSQKLVRSLQRLGKDEFIMVKGGLLPYPFSNFLIFFFLFSLLPYFVVAMRLTFVCNLINS